MLRFAAPKAGALLRAVCVVVAMSGLVGCDCGPANPAFDAGSEGGGSGEGGGIGGGVGGGDTGGGGGALGGGGGADGGGAGGGVGGGTGGNMGGGGGTGGGGAPMCVDGDNDGYGDNCAMGADCDDTDPLAFPGAAERCNGKDDNCNAQVDEALADLSCGVGACAQTTAACIDGGAQTCTPLMPGTETCNGLDDDCNGTVDDGPAGQAMACMTGAVGVCAPGLTQCSDGGVVCVPLMTASALEACNGLDDTCDGVVDENDPDGGVACVTGQLGACASGLTQCDDGGITCLPLATPTNEACNNIDDNCDGTVDDGNPDSGVACDTGQLGVCGAGLTDCAPGGAIVCTQRFMPVPEQCNGLDDDCNGSVDNGNPGSGASCNTGVPGQCAAGATSCLDGGIECVQTVMPVPEQCNGLDDDCNGSVDNGNPDSGVACSTGQLGRCAAGTTTCASGSISCQRTNGPIAEVCNAIDDDCDGVVNNGNPGGGMPCNTGLLGACSAGVTQCSGGSIICVQTVFASPEVCDGIDNNCNGTIDDGNPSGGFSCNTGQLGVCAAGTTACSGGAVVCNRNTNPGAEACNGLDDNCNGSVDEGDPGSGASCSTGNLGVCSAGTRHCLAGALACVQNQMPGAELCNGLDDNCNGTTDEGNPGGGGSCNTGQSGICAAGTTQCQGGALSCQRNLNPATEVCNGLDDNCDGQVDINPVAADGIPNSCAAASNLTLTVNPGTTQDLSGYIDVAGNDFFVVNFTGPGGPGAYFHPKLELVSTAGGQFVMQVLNPGCGSAATGCTGTLTVWEMSYPSNPDSCLTFGNCSDATPRVTSVVVRVQRTVGQPNCSTYTLRASNL